MSTYAVRRKDTKEFFGLVTSSQANLFDTIDMEANPYEFEYSVSKFKNTSVDFPAEWMAFDDNQELVKI
jgi:hypothetical protein